MPTVLTQTRLSLIRTASAINSKNRVCLTGPCCCSRTELITRHLKTDRVHPPIHGIYAITRDESDTAKLTFQVGEALAGGVRLVQYRNKSASKILAREQAFALRGLTASAGALLIVNDDIDLAIAISSDGVHLGREEGIDDKLNDLSQIRQRAGQKIPGQFLIGLSCYNDLARASSAAEAGADYIAFGSFFPSRTKPAAIRADVSLIRDAKQRFRLPVVAIGGITLENAPQLIAAGADSVAVISSLFDTDNVRSRAHLLSSLFYEYV